MANPRVEVNFTVNATGYSAAVGKMKAQAIDFGEATKRVSHGMITDVQATSGALRLLEGGINNNLRAAERWLASIKGVGAAMQSVYSGVGLIAVGAIIAKGATEFYKLAQAGKTAANALSDAFRTSAVDAEKQNSALQVTNDKLENQIAKLSGKPQNRLKEALDEARDSANSLAKSLDTAIDAELKLLQEHGITGVKALFTNVASTAPVTNAVNREQQAQLDSSYARSQELKGATTPQEADAINAKYDAQDRGRLQSAASEANKNLPVLQQLQELHDLQAKSRAGAFTHLGNGLSPQENARQAQLRASLGSLDRSKYSSDISADLGVVNSPLQYLPDQTAKINATKIARNGFSSQSDLIGFSAQNRTDEAANAIAQGKKEQADLAKAAAERLRAEQKAAAEALQKDMKDQLDAAKRDHEVSITEESEFWASAITAVRGGSEPMLTLRLEINNRLAELGQEQRKILAKYQNQDAQGNPTGSVKVHESLKLETDIESIKKAAADEKEQAEAKEKSASAAAEENAQYAEAVIHIKEAAGEISKLDAAQQLADIHAKEYAAQTAAIQGSIDFWQKAPLGAERDKHLDDANRQLGQLHNQNNITVMQDQQSVAAQTPIGAWTDALNQFVQRSRDTASQVRDIWSSALSGVNDEIVKVISTRHNYNTRVEFGNLGAGMFRNVASAGLSKAEGALLGGLGFGGKPDGSPGKEFHVIIAGATAAASAVGGVLGKVLGGGSTSQQNKQGGGNWFTNLIGTVLGGGKSNSADSNAGGSDNSDDSSWGSLLSKLGFADGGFPPIDKASLVGERGPELFVPKVAGTIVPNDQLGGGDTHHHWNIDARGNPDPTQTIAIVRREMAKGAPQQAALTAHAIQNAKARMPMSRRS